MATANGNTFLRHLMWGMIAETLADLTDMQLVERACADRDEASFEAILSRHGPMVFRVCWRILRQEQDTEDAFQATFLVLAHKLHTLRRHASLASWLHGIARRVALKARAAGRHHHADEQKAKMEKPLPDEVSQRELSTVLDAELAELPEKWRAPLVFCYLEEQTQDEDFKTLETDKAQIEKEIGEPFDWRELPLKETSRIILARSGSSPQTSEGATVHQRLAG